MSIPQSEHLDIGFATSSFQEGGFNHNESYIDFFRTGLNPELKQVWEDRLKLLSRSRIFPERLRTSVSAILNRDLEKKIHYKENVHRLTQHDPLLHTIELDVDLMELVLSEADNETGEQSHAIAFIDGIVDSIRYASANNFDTDIIINQYAGDESVNSREERYDSIKQRLNTHIINRAVDIDDLESRLVIEPIREVGPDYWHNYIENVAASGSKIVRISAEWSRFIDYESESGTQTINPDYAAELKSIIKYAHDKGLEFMLCMHHFTLPTWIDGGWTNPQVVDLFSDYVVGALDSLGSDLPDQVMTINEPNSFLPAGYVDGSWPPYQKENQIALGFTNLDSARGTADSKSNFLVAHEHTIQAHIKTYDRIKSHPNLGHIPVGFSYNLPSFKPWDNSILTPINAALIVPKVQTLNNFWVERMLEISKQRGNFPFDYFGLQYYCRYYLGVTRQSVSANPGNQAVVPERMRPHINGWGTHPEGIIEKIMFLNRKMLGVAIDIGAESLPSIPITELGVPGIVNPNRHLARLVESTEVARNLSISDVPRALLWTMVDNFEWAAKHGLGTFGQHDRRHRPKPHSNENIPELDFTDSDLQKEAVQLISTIKSALNVLNPETSLHQQLRLKLATIETFHMQFGSAYNKQKTGYLAILGRIMNNS